MSQVELPKHLEPERLKQLSVEQLVALIMEQQRVIELLQQQVERLKVSAALDSKTSSKPPSTDLLKKTTKGEKSASPNSPEKNKRRPGGQPGHPGKTRKGFDRVDRYEKLRPERCCYCGNTNFELEAVRVKVSGGSRSMERFRETATLLSVAQTCRFQGRSVMQFLRETLMANAHKGFPCPSLIPPTPT